MKEKGLIPTALTGNIMLLFALYAICRITFLLCNLNMFYDDLSWSLFLRMMYGGFIFDASAIGYTNILYIILALLPFSQTRLSWWNYLLKFLFVVVNSICLLSCLVDAVYFPFGTHRATTLTFSEFGGNTNILSIVGIEMLHHWYLTLLGLVIIVILAKGYKHHQPNLKPHLRYCVSQTVWFTVMATLTVISIRGGVTTAIRPLAVSNAHQYVDKPNQTGIVLNTPFSIIRTYGKGDVSIPEWFTVDELDKIYSPLHIPTKGLEPHKRNIVIMIVESFAREYIGAYNRELDNGKYQGYTPFTDSLIQHSTAYSYAFANGAVSVDAIPAVTSSIPRFKHPFCLSPYSLDSISGIANLLRDWGYSTAFFHGAENSSMGFQAYARHAGFQRYYGRTEYNKDKRFSGDKDFDGTWAIWDEPYLQYFAAHIDDLPQPFCAAVFTASSHHPFAVPEQYKDIYKDEGGLPIHKCVRYTDNALRHFFSTVRSKSWFRNTLFVIVADHASNFVSHAEYETELGHYRVPLIFYDPQDKSAPGIVSRVAQQIDIMPTLLGMVGYNRPYVAFGRDLCNADSLQWAFSWNHLPIWIESEQVMFFDNEQINAETVYNYIQDPLLRKNLYKATPQQKDMIRRAKAFMQSCYKRMKENRLKEP